MGNSVLSALCLQISCLALITIANREAGPSNAPLTGIGALLAIQVILGTFRGAKIMPHNL